MVTLGTKLRNLRTKENLSQSRIADILEVSQNAYHKWESDKSKPSVGNLLKILNHYHVSVQELLDENEKIILSDNTITGDNNIIAGTVPNINIHLSARIKQALLDHDRMIHQMESQYNLLKEISEIL
ncbi:MAG: helix-turn-helix domain-containing protein [Dysgonamonadaceae bacterium]|jgi:transcriptional regulator with XRE-family HTH domain|nr:helix-turn-helix domain-containing protein [Dysgonamonadaceae bacterium]